MQQPDTKQALAMLAAFASVGVRSLDVTFTDIDGAKTGFQMNRPIDKTLAAACPFGKPAHFSTSSPSSETVPLRDPVMPIADGFGSRFARVHGAQLR
jgi:hypothetical protein